MPFMDPSSTLDMPHIPLAEAGDIVHAIRLGVVDALVIHREAGPEVFTLHSADEPYRHLVDLTQDGVAVLTNRGDIKYSNRRLSEMIGVSADVMAGTPVQRFIEASGAHDFEALLAAGHGVLQTCLHGPASPMLHVELSLSTTPSASGGRLNLTVTDLTDVLAARSARARAERENNAKDVVLGMLAHELRNPLMAIASAIKVLELTRAEGPRAIRASEMVARQMHHMAALISEMLDVGQVVSHNVRLNRVPLNLAAAVEQAVATVLSGAGSDRRIEVTAEPVWIEADAIRIEQVLTNLLTNAVKYTPASGSVSVDVHASGDEAVITIDDTGAGIAPAVLPFIFDLYVQSDRTIDRARGGIGIGLALVQRLVELHGGTIQVSSGGEGLGSRFVVRLKRAPAASGGILNSSTGS